MCLCRPENGIALIKACWNELFALGLAQCADIMNVEMILSAIVTHLQSSLEEGKSSRSAGLVVYLSMVFMKSIMDLNVCLCVCV